MSQTVFSNISLNLPLSYGKTSSTSASSSSSKSLCCSRLPLFFYPTGGKLQSNSLRVMATGEAKENLDHLQRPNKHQYQQPKKRVTPVAPIGLWDRFPTARTVQQMMETMERVMEDPFAFGSDVWPSSALPTEAGGYRRGRTPWEIKEGEGEYKMRFDMPGMTKDDVKVWVEEKMLVVKAEKVPKKKSNGETEEGDWSAKSYGRYSSRIALPENIQFDKIKAEVKDGVLYITIPKASISSQVLDIDVQ